MTIVDVDPERTYPAVGVLNRGRGLLHRDPLPGSATAYKTLNRVGPGMLVYSRLKAFEGAITVTPDDLQESFASQEFPTFDFAPGASPDFFRILATTQIMWDALQGVSKGMGGRRERVKPADFLGIVMEIPSLPIQERIVRIVDAVDDLIIALDAEVDAIARVRAGMVGTAADVQHLSIGSLGTVSQGRGLPKRYQGKRTGEISWYKIADMTGPGNEFGYTLADTRLSTSDVTDIGGVVVGAGAVTFPRVGAAVLTEKKRILDVPGALDENHLVIAPGESVNPEYLLAVMENFTLASLVRPGAVPSLNMSLIRSTKVPWSWTENESLGDALGALRAEARALATEAACLRKARAGLLAALLSRTVQIEPAG
ncbi:hypothetical protein [Micromonospora tulbaghiae]|uniref:hypothetical protein n=1 Tax=Micromonospora tulbaghiae TaxID=479978 RepID=UPI0033D0C8ED